MVAVVEKLGGAFGESGLLVLPCVAAHVNQVGYSCFSFSFLIVFSYMTDTKYKL